MYNIKKTTPQKKKICLQVQCFTSYKIELYNLKLIYKKNVKKKIVLQKEKK